MQNAFLREYQSRLVIAFPYLMPLKACGLSLIAEDILKLELLINYSCTCPAIRDELNTSQLEGFVKASYIP